MHTDDLRALLRRLSREPAAPDDVASVRSALRSHPLGEGMDVSTLLTDDVPGDAHALLAVLDDPVDAAGIGLRDAVRDGGDTAGPGGPIDVADGVMAAIFGAMPALDVAPALAFEADGGPEVASGFDPGALPVAEAVVHAAGRSPELAAGFDAAALPLAAALRDEAGELDVLAAVLARVAPETVAVRTPAAVVAPVATPPASDVPDPVHEGDDLPEGWLAGLLDRALSTPQHVAAAERVGADPRLRAELAGLADVGRVLREAVTAEAGRAPQAWSAVAPAIGLDDPEAVPGWDEALLAEAIRVQAGTVDVTDRVVGAISRDVERAQGRARDLASDDVTAVPAPANTPWWPALGMVAAAAVVFMTLLPLWMGDPSAPSGFTERPVDFASADEINVDAVRYGENASVFVEMPTADDDPVIIWVDDGGSL